MIFALLITAAFVGVMLQLVALTREMFRASCLCRKGAVNLDCPIHGRNA